MIKLGKSSASGTTECAGLLTIIVLFMFQVLHCGRGYHMASTMNDVCAACLYMYMHFAVHDHHDDRRLKLYLPVFIPVDASWCTVSSSCNKGELSEPGLLRVALRNASSERIVWLYRWNYTTSINCVINNCATINKMVYCFYTNLNFDGAVWVIRDHSCVQM